MRFLAFAFLAIATVTADGEKKICEPGARSQLECNTCVCSEDGTAQYCTLKLCNAQDATELLARSTESVRQTREIEESDIDTCEPGRTFKKYCNSCRCSRDGKYALCTQMYCDPKLYNEDGSLTIPNEFFSSDETRNVKQSCEPGKHFMDYCNQCVCGSDGQHAACTRIYCSPDIFNKDGSIKVHDISKRDVAQICEPGKRFKDHCNDCLCARDGTAAACTKMTCPPNVFNKDGSLNLPHGLSMNALLRESRDVTQQICEPGKRFKNYCNDCLCARDGTAAACTKMACPPNVFNKDGSLKIAHELSKDALLREKRDVTEEICEPGKRFKNYCNDCLCARDGTAAACTKMACPPNVFNKDGSLQIAHELSKDALLREKRDVTEQICEPGKRFKNYCNDCLCARDGTAAACTKMACPPNIFNKDGSFKIAHELSKNPLLRESRDVTEQICEPGKRFKDYCNDCLCAGDGTAAACTKMACPPNVFNKDGSLQIAHELSKDALLREKRDVTEQICEPGKRFKNYCNDCLCARDGKGAACTKMACSPNVFNKDGSSRLPRDILNNPLLRQERKLSEEKIICEPHAHYKDDCNDCECSADGLRAVCTFKLCLPKITKEKRSVSFEDSRTCESGKTFKDDCNECVCGDNGRTALCTTKLCFPAALRIANSASIESPIRVCEPGKSFKNACNDCKCSGDGAHALCTLKHCPAETYLRKRRQAIEPASQICTPGRRFKKGCNSCVCGDDGITASCTLILCIGN